MKKLSFNYLRKFICEQKCMPYFLYKRVKDTEIYNRLKVEFFHAARCVKKGCDIRGREGISFLIPHYNASRFCKYCVESIVRSTIDVPYEILIADAGSESEEYTALVKMVNSIQKKEFVYLWAFTKQRFHSFVLEFLFRKAKKRFVLILDQDSILLNENFLNLLKEFDVNPNLIAIGIRDFCEHRKNYRMLHPSFILMDKLRTVSRVKEKILFFGRKPNIEKLITSRKAFVEPYYSLVCKIHKWCGEEAISYLNTYRTNYLYGTVGYWKTPDVPVIFHKWYSGRIKGYRDDMMIDGVLVKLIREDIDRFESDLKQNILDLSPKEIFMPPQK